MNTLSTTIELNLLPGELFWGGVIRHGDQMPYGLVPYTDTLVGTLDGNQGCPLLVSNRGRYLWCEEAFAFEFREGKLILSGLRSGVTVEEGWEDLRGAYRAASRRFFPPSGTLPNPLSFTVPQYNTWIDMKRFPSQVKVLDYARVILDSGMPPGVFMIDDWWHVYNGKWEFKQPEFPDPKAMVDELHALGFLVMVWISPFICPESLEYWQLKNETLLLRDHTGEPALYRWWNGASAILDLSHPQAVEWYQSALRHLQDRYGIDGFKFDAGDPDIFAQVDSQSFFPRTANGLCEDFARIGTQFDLSEYRACWKQGGQALLHRTRDKVHAWGKNGLADLIPSGLAQGIIGYPYNCPDMVGGGDVESTGDFDQELFVRWAQCSTFFPILQYSLLPARVLDAEHLGYCQALTELRYRIGPDILALARLASTTGEPIMRYLEYGFPNQGFESVLDQYLVGDRYLVAPVLVKGARTRRVRFPAGVWKGDDGSLVQGPTEQEISVPLSRLPWYFRQDGNTEAP